MNPVKTNMKTSGAVAIVVVALFSASLVAQDSGSGKAKAKGGDAWTRTLEDRADRSALSDHQEKVRGLRQLN